MGEAVMGELEFADPRSAWGGEASAFTPAIASRLAYLGDACGLGPLELEGTEVSVGTRRIDVLATVEQRAVVIENQYGVSDHDHLTRGLAYAVAKDASGLIVIAERHSDEFVAVAEYLNRLASYAGDDGSVSVWLVEVQAVRRVGDSIWSPLFTVRAQPNEWEQAVRATTRHNVSEVADVIAQCDDPTLASWIVEQWLGEAHSGAIVGGGKKPTVQLRHPDPADPIRGHALMTLMLRRLWVNAVYILDSSGAFERAGDQAALESRLRDAFPAAAARHSDLPAYFAIEYNEIEARRDEFVGFSTWLMAHLDTQIAEADDSAIGMQ